MGHMKTSVKIRGLLLLLLEYFVAGSWTSLSFITLVQ